MKQPEIQCYTDIPGAANQGLELRSISGPYDPSDDMHARHHVWRDGLIQGWPGFVRNGTMSIAQVDQYIGMPRRSEYPVDLRNVIVSSFRDGLLEPTAIAFYGRSMTRGGIAAEAEDISSAHVSTFAIARETRRGRWLDNAEMRAAGAVLAHSVVLDAAEYGYDRIAFKVERFHKDALYAEAGKLGLAPLVYEHDPSFAVPVNDRRHMVRTEVAFDVQQLAEALPAAEDLRWLAGREPLAAQ